MLQFYDKAFAASVLALAALAAPVSADVADSASSACDLSDGYASGVIGFTAEAEACLAQHQHDAHAETHAGVMALTERHRARFNLDGFETRATLDMAATAHAMDMAARGYAAHADELGRSHSERLRMFDRTLLVGASGANITIVPAGTDPVDVFNALISDPVNAANLTRDVFTHAGLGMAESADGRTYVVQVFAQVDGELDTALPLTLSNLADVEASFIDPRFSQAGWRLETADGVALRRGNGERIAARALDGVTAYLDIEATLGTQTYQLSGPAVEAR